MRLTANRCYTVICVASHACLRLYARSLSCQVETLEEVEELVVLGGRNRTVGNNNVNEHSSRSHLVLQVHITSTDTATGYVQHGKLNLIDLAGSERIKVRHLEGLLFGHIWTCGKHQPK